MFLNGLMHGEERENFADQTYVCPRQSTASNTHAFDVVKLPLETAFYIVVQVILHLSLAPVA